MVNVADGDTVTVLRDGRDQVKIRLYGVDAPERKQPWGNRASQWVTAKTKGQEVDVVQMDTDRYGRVVARLVLADGRDVGLALIQDGLAWAWPKYCKDVTVCPAMIAAQEQARLKNRGLWADKSPIPPWEWRRKGK